MTQGLAVIGVGLLVVLVIILSMFASVELILKVDQVLRDRGKPARAPRGAPQPEPPRGAEGNSDDAIAAIGLALHRHLFEPTAVTSPASGAAPGSGSAAWACSGRTETMRTRRDMTSRYRRGGERGR